MKIEQKYVGCSSLWNALVSFIINSFDVLVLWWLICFEFTVTSPEKGKMYSPTLCVGVVCCSN
jgi:hypothetical protein